jgi:hypothetical protein
MTTIDIEKAVAMIMDEELSASCMKKTIAILRQLAEEQPDGWQPISSAPEATRVMVWLPNYGHVTASYTTEFTQQYWWTKEQRVYPTHWMPLPSPPTHDTSSRTKDNADDIRS